MVGDSPQLRAPSHPLLGRPYAVEPAQELGEIVTGRGNLVPLVQVLQAAQGGAPHPAVMYSPSGGSAGFPFSLRVARRRTRCRHGELQREA